jgi:hypothetical protein
VGAALGGNIYAVVVAAISPLIGIRITAKGVSIVGQVTVRPRKGSGSAHCERRA